jgi:hypothetical protein
MIVFDFAAHPMDTFSTGAATASEGSENRRKLSGERGEQPANSRLYQEFGRHLRRKMVRSPGVALSGEPRLRCF